MRLTVHHGMLGISDQQEGAALISALTHQLSGRIAYWSPHKPCHWVYRHETDADGFLLSRVLLLFIPEDVLDRAIGWLRSFMSGQGRTAGDALIISSRRKSSVEQLVRFNWQGVRALSRS